MKIKKTKFKDLLIFNSKNFFDKRGLFRELAIQKFLKEKLVFTVVSKSKKMCLEVCICKKKINKANIFLC